MSSRSSASSKTATTTNTTDARIAADGGATVVAGGSTVNMIDGGAIALTGDIGAQALDLAAGVADLGANFALDALGFVSQNQNKTNAIVSQVLDQTRAESTQLGSQLIKLGIPALVILVIFTGWAKR